VVVCLVALIGAPAVGDISVGADDVGQLRRRIFQAFTDDDPATAAVLIDVYLHRVPDDGRMIYNAACAACRLGRLPEAEQFLLDAVREGFLDFSRMRRDPDLDPIRDSDVYHALMAARDAADPVLADRARNEWLKTFGEGYRFETDPHRNLTYATALSAASQEHVRGRVETQTDHLVELLFEAPPTHMVLVGLARPDDVRRVFGDPNVHGHYQHQMRRLIAADADRALQHELVHVLHSAHMDRLGQQHPIWLQEALACLYESWELCDEGGQEYLPNDRDRQVRTLASRGQLLSWSELFRLTPEGFRRRALVVYPQVRSMARFLAEHADLAEWYGWYTTNYDADPTGALSLEHAMGERVDELEAFWRFWLQEEPASTPDEHLTTLEWTCELPPEPPRSEADLEADRLYAEARLLYSMGRYAAAVEAFQLVVAVSPDHAKARYDLALAAIRIGDLDTGRAQCDRLSTLDPSLASLLGNLLH
jgi:tetratricopeptide (TPR) repeat protein